MLNRSEEAITDYSLALSFDPANIFLLFGIANARIAYLEDLLDQSANKINMSGYHNSYALRVYSDILYDLHRILDLDPGFLYARYNIGYCRFLMEDYAGALTEFTIVVKKRKIAEAHFNKALLQIFLDQREEGCLELGIAGELGLKEAYSVIRKFCN
jgi:tetratricopeptide (TPR) repeat protein